MSDTQNPLLKNKLPGRTFQLPSRAALYTSGEVEAPTGEIHIHPMSALVEINLKNADLLFSGKALEAVVAECAPAIKKPLELFGRDVDALMFFLRLTTYGSEYRIEVAHDCDGATSHSYTVNLEDLVSQMEFLDPTTIETLRTVTLPTGEIVKTRPLKFRDFINLFQHTGSKKELSVDDIKELAITNLLGMIETVNEVDNPKFIEEWLRTLTTPQVNRIQNCANALNNWGPLQTVTLKCKDCGSDFKVELPLNPISFFTE